MTGMVLVANLVNGHSLGRNGDLSQFHSKDNSVTGVFHTCRDEILEGAAVG
jgi:hypothetical protein